MKSQLECCRKAHRDLEQSIDRITQATYLLEGLVDEEGEDTEEGEELDKLLTALGARSYDLEVWLDSKSG